jgi:ABC-type glycerol-3-phosphate transport system permease component
MAGRALQWKHVRHNWEIYLFVVPMLILIGLFQYYPALSGIIHSFYRWNGADVSEYRGFYNYTSLLKNNEFWQSFELAFTLGIWNLVKMIPAVAVAVCIHRCSSDRLQFFYRCLFVIPMVIPGIVVVLIWRSFFFEATTGFLNRILDASGLMNVLVWLDHSLFHWGVFMAGQQPAWLGDPKLIIAACILWGFPWVGSFAVLMYLAKLQSIDKEIYEAADVDGVSWWSKFTSLEFPMLAGSLRIVVIMAIIETIKDAGMILALAGMTGGPGGKATVPALFMLRKAFIDQDMGYACAIGIILTGILMILQKFSNLVAQWADLTRGQRTRIRLFSLTLGIGILAGSHFYFAEYRFVSLAVGLLLLGFPYGVLTWPWRRLAAWREARRRAPASALPTSRDRVNPMGKTTEWGLRVLKHATIWAVLAAAFLPLYIMIVVSFKTNQEFYLDPAGLPTVLRWHYWVDAWVALSPCLANSVFISIATTSLTLMLALAAAYFFARFQMPLSGLFWNAILILMMMPAIANLIPLFILLKDLNLLNTLSSLIIVGASGGQIFAVFVLRSFVEDIPHALFEAAEIDGANHWQQFKTIVIPMSGPILGTVGIMNFVAVWNDFVMPLIVIRDYEKLPVTVALLRMAGEYIKFWGPLMAGYMIASLPVIFIFLSSMKLFIKGLTAGAVKG